MKKSEVVNFEWSDEQLEVSEEQLEELTNYNPWE